MDKCLIWFYWRYRDYKTDLEKYKTTEHYSKNAEFNKMFKDIAWLSLNNRIISLFFALSSDIATIIKEGFNGEKVKIKNKFKELNLRFELIEEIHKERKEFEKLKPYEDKQEQQNIKQEVENLKKKLKD